MTRLLATLFLALAWLAPAAYGADEGVTLTLSTVSAVHGDAVVAAGQLQAPTGAQEVVVEVSAGDTWLELARTITDATGSFTTEFEATRGGLVRARTVMPEVLSSPIYLEVIPDVGLRAAPGRAFVGARVQARVRPATYEGRVSIVVRRGTEIVATLSRKVSKGRLRTVVPTPGTGRFVVVMTFPAADGLGSRLASIRLRSSARTLSVGSRGADVRALTRELARLRIHVPAMSQDFGYELYDSVIAFQKAYGLPRDGVVAWQTWRALTRVEPLEPRLRGPAAHIEVDKTRQILLDVRGGRVVSVLPVSSGATGNTPEGKHQIRWKAPATTTWLGPAILYRTLTFYGDSFAIHGFPSVPAYPASHGCVRIPIWTADWLYNRSPVGETVYVYR
jgi:hypothetical protein